jgi:outer membrane lipoprotein carrier protein
MKMRVTFQLVVAAFAVVASTPLLVAQQSPVELAQALQKKYDTVRDFQAGFTQVTESGVLGRKHTERGQVAIKKPGKMRWDYESPEKKLFISDGRHVYLYTPRDKQATVSDVPSGDSTPTPFLFLAGQGNLTRDFTPSAIAPPGGLPAGTQAVKLTPKQAQPDYEWLIVSVDPATYSLRGLTFRDAQGATQTFTFSSLKENLNPAESKFHFKIPSGTQVVR